jgi:hypothetical protein
LLRAIDAPVRPLADEPDLLEELLPAVDFLLAADLVDDEREEPLFFERLEDELLPDDELLDEEDFEPDLEEELLPLELVVFFIDIGV